MPNAEVNWERLARQLVLREECSSYASLLGIVVDVDLHGVERHLNRRPMAERCPGLRVREAMPAYGIEAMAVDEVFLREAIRGRMEHPRRFNNPIAAIRYAIEERNRAVVRWTIIGESDRRWVELAFAFRCVRPFDDTYQSKWYLERTYLNSLDYDVDRRPAWDTRIESCTGLAQDRLDRLDEIGISGRIQTGQAREDVDRLHTYYEIALERLNLYTYDSLAELDVEQEQPDN